MNLLPKDMLVQTSRVDHADWNYHPVLRHVSRTRFALVLSLLPRRRVPRLLEVGYGSGIFMPELAQRCESLYGIDVHNETATVQQALAAQGIRAILAAQDAARTDFPDAFFDEIVAVSALEFITDIDGAAAELARILRPGGRLVAVMPRKLPALDWALAVATGESAERDYGNRREAVVPALQPYFRVVRTRTTVPIYIAYEFERLPQPQTASIEEPARSQPASR